MKKVRILLAASAVVAVIGGISAVKALSTDHVYTRQSPAINNCQVKVDFATLDQTDIPLQSTFVTLTPGPCPDVKQIYSSN
ncbi:hypothetical protein ACTJJB_12865 [Chitinophaga sp. 22536]|uniref:hypothetical protein n=1 Tax=unclassified Chitinophaga TaxID=2619133 RepID=UPI003F86132D